MSLKRTFAAALLLATAMHAQTVAVPQHPVSTPYAGDLGIFEEKGREDRLHIDRVMDALHLAPGKVVADIGAGGGWFSVRAARRVAGTAPGAPTNAPGGIVIAEDINAKYVDAIRERAQREKLTNIEPVLGTVDDPKLAADSVDAVLMLKVYHELAHPATVLANLHKAMRPGARFGIIDRNGKGDDHGLNEKIVRAEVERNGFRQVARYDFTKDDGQDYFLVLKRSERRRERKADPPAARKDDNSFGV